MMLKLVRWIENTYNMKIQTRMLCIYIIGGLLPMIFTCFYLMRGTNRLLIQQARNGEFVELQNMKRQMLESLNMVSSVSQYFYFDEKLEHIAFHEYDDYQELVDDYKTYSAFQTYENYYNNIIRWICIYIDNTTISSNARFIKVDTTYKENKWCQSAQEKKGKIIWRYMENSTKQGKFLSLVRLIRSRSQKNVGTLVIHIRSECLKELLMAQNGMTYLYLDGKQLISMSDGGIDPEFVKSEIKDLEGNTISKDVSYGGLSYVLYTINVSLPESDNKIQIVSLQSRKSILKDANSQGLQSLAFMLVGIALSLIMIISFSHGFSRRVNCFRLQIQKAASGSFDLEQKIGGNDEISELYGYLSNMIYSIQYLLSQIYMEQLQKEKLKTRQKDAEFKMLASQINPHFLYNTLETIRMTARNNGQYEIEELVKMLAKLLRRNIQAGNKMVSLRSEMELLEYYLKIQQYRFGDRIQYHIEYEEWMTEFKVLPLLMQPIVENSIVHGLELREDSGNLWIRAVKELGAVKIIVEDDGAGITEQRLQQIRYDLNDSEELDRTHIGISNVYHRIRLMYGENGGLTIRSKEGVGTRVEIMLPEKPEL